MGSLYFSLNFLCKPKTASPTKYSSNFLKMWSRNKSKTIYFKDLYTYYK